MTLSWLSIIRLGLVQMCLGAVVVLTTSTLNRLMVVELALPALLPGFLVALHYGIQISRPNWGYRSDTSGNRTRWVIGGMAILFAGVWAGLLWGADGHLPLLISGTVGACFAAALLGRWALLSGKRSAV